MCFFSKAWIFSNFFVFLFGVNRFDVGLPRGDDGFLLFQSAVGKSDGKLKDHRIFEQDSELSLLFLFLMLQFWKF